MKIKIFYITFLLIYSFGGNIFAEYSFKNNITAKGDILILDGKVLDKLGNPVPDINVEIWQTDYNGIYDHSGDRNRKMKDPGFQFFGTSKSDKLGNYYFRTILPGKYEPRPRHIHVKVKRSGKVLLITQIYFVMDGETQGVGGSNKTLRINLKKMDNMKNIQSYTGTFNIIIDTGVKGDLSTTISQLEGPYYPQVNVELYDNDLVNVK